MDTFIGIVTNPIFAGVATFLMLASLAILNHNRAVGWAQAKRGADANRSWDYALN